MGVLKAQLEEQTKTIAALQKSIEDANRDHSNAEATHNKRLVDLEGELTLLRASLAEWKDKEARWSAERGAIREVALREAAAASKVGGTTQRATDDACVFFTTTQANTFRRDFGPWGRGRATPRRSWQINVSATETCKTRGKKCIRGNGKFSQVDGARSQQ